RNGWPLLVAAFVGVGVNRVAIIVGLQPIIVAHLTIWLPALAFAMALLWMSRSRVPSTSRAARALAFAAFVGVCLQAALGGLRVTQETGGNPHLALRLAIAHACVAQAELCVLVAVATLLSREWIM